MSNSSFYFAKMEMYHQRIRKERRKKQYSQFRHKYIMNLKNILPSSNIYSIKTILKFIEEYNTSHQTIGDNIEQLIQLLVLALDSCSQNNFQFGSQIVKILMKFYYSVEKEGQVSYKTQDKILCVIACLPSFLNLITLEVVIEYQIIQFIIDLFRRNINQSKLIFYLIDQLSSINQIKLFCLKSKELTKEIEQVMKRISVNLKQNQNASLIKLLLSWWGNIDLAKHNIQTTEIIYSLYQIANETLSKYYIYYQTNEINQVNQVNQISIVNALKIMHNLLNLYSQDMLKRQQYKISLNNYCCLMVDQNIIEGKHWIIRIMYLLITQSQFFNCQNIQNINNVVKILMNPKQRNKKLTILSLNNLILRVGPMRSIFCAVQSLVDELFIESFQFCNQNQKLSILSLVEVWLFHKQKSELEFQNLNLIESLRYFKSPIDIDHETRIWKNLRKIGCSKECARYINEIELEQ